MVKIDLQDDCEFEIIHIFNEEKSRRIIQALPDSKPLTYEEILKMFDLEYQDKHCIYMLAENQVFGEVYCYNNYDNKILYKTGKTEGYA